MKLPYFIRPLNKAELEMQQDLGSRINQYEKQLKNSVGRADAADVDRTIACFIKETNAYVQRLPTSRYARKTLENLQELRKAYGLRDGMGGVDTTSLECYDVITN